MSGLCQCGCGGTTTNRFRRGHCKKIAYPPYTGTGLCECGCGRKTKIATQTSRKSGETRGYPRRFVFGHHLRSSGVDYIVDAKTGCWNWNLSLTSHGYGGSLDGKRAYVTYYEQKHGAVPEGMELDHKCRNRRCVNPDHLEPVTHAENVRRGKSTKLTADQVREIRLRKRATRVKFTQLAEEYFVSPYTIQDIVYGRSWKSV